LETGLSQYFLDITFLSFTTGTAISIVVCVMLLVSSAMISGAEIAYFSLSPKDMEDLKSHDSKTNKLILKNLKKPELLLATILIGNNFVNVGIVMLSTFIVNSLVDFGTSATLKFIIEIVGITGLILLFGEIIPKIYASHFSKKFASVMAYPLMIMIKVFKPLGLVLTKSTNIVNKRLAKKKRTLSMDELSHAVELTSPEIEEEKEIMEGIVLSPSVSYFSGSTLYGYKNNLLAFDVNGQYIIEIMTDELKVYPLAGLNYSNYKHGFNTSNNLIRTSNTGNALGLNIGGGGRWYFSDQILGRLH